MLYLLTFLFSEDLDHQPKAQSHFGTLSEKSQHLEHLSRDRVLRGLTPWQVWLQGESARRTILTSYVLVCAYTSWRHGYCMHRLDLEAFPFDGRRGLWMAESAQAWIAAAGEVHGEGVEPRLVSFHEYGGTNPRVSWDPDGDIFLDMMVVAHRGKLRRLPNGEFGWGHEDGILLEALEEAGWGHLDLSTRSLLPYDSNGNEVMSSPRTASVYGTPPDVPDAILRGDGPVGAEVQAAWDDDVPLDLDDLCDDTQTRARQVKAD